MDFKTELKAMYDQASVGLFANDAERDANWVTINRLINEKAAQERAEHRAATAQRRADREARTYRGATDPTPTCSVCGMQHRGEC